MPSRLVSVDDDETIGRSLTQAFESKAYDVTWAAAAAPAAPRPYNDRPPVSVGVAASAPTSQNAV